MQLDPDLQDHLDREAAFSAHYAWPPISDNQEPGTMNRERKLLHPWTIDREAALRALTLPAAGDNTLDTALTALWLLSHDEQAITLLRIQSLARQYETIRDWCRNNILVSDRDALLALVDEIFTAADQNKTLPAHEGGASSGNAPRP